MARRKEIHSFRIGDGSYCEPGFRDILPHTVINQFITELEHESDRSMVLVAASFFDELLSKRLRLYLKNGKKLEATLLNNGFLSSFSSKIDLLFLLGHIDKNIADDLHTIRKIRNLCAHNWDTFKLSEEIERKYLLNINTKIKSEGDCDNFSFNTDVLNPRARLIVICAMLGVMINIVEDKKLDIEDGTRKS